MYQVWSPQLAALAAWFFQFGALLGEVCVSQISSLVALFEQPLGLGLKLRWFRQYNP
jgi:hypothetical protein